MLIYPLEMHRDAIIQIREPSDIKPISAKRLVAMCFDFKQFLGIRLKSFEQLEGALWRNRDRRRNELSNLECNYQRPVPLIYLMGRLTDYLKGQPVKRRALKVFHRSFFPERLLYKAQSLLG